MSYDEEKRVFSTEKGRGRSFSDPRKKPRNFLSLLFIDGEKVNAKSRSLRLRNVAIKRRSKNSSKILINSDCTDMLGLLVFLVLCLTHLPWLDNQSLL